LPTAPLVLTLPMVIVIAVSGTSVGSFAVKTIPPPEVASVTVAAVMFCVAGPGN
jgi:hypothetical protein